MRRYDDPVEVRKGADEDPEQFLWRGRLWQVREVVAHWVETGAWWARRQCQTGRDAPGLDTDLLREREVWRVEAARGRVAAGQSAGARPRLRGLRPGLQLVRGQLAARPGDGLRRDPDTNDR